VSTLPPTRFVSPTTAHAVGVWLTASGLADQVEGRDLWLSGLDFYCRLTALCVGRIEELTQHEQMQLARVTGSVLNLLCALGWVEPGKRGHYIDDLATWHERLRNEHA
jgi:hypothetical protein